MKPTPKNRCPHCDSNLNGEPVSDHCPHCLGSLLDDVPCTHGNYDTCEICDAYGGLPDPPKHGEELGSFLRRTNPE